MSLLRSVAQEISLDPGFDSLLEYLTSAGSEVTVVSDGFGFYVDDMCQGRVPVMTNRVVDNRMEFPYSNPDCACARCGTCKPAPIHSAGTRGQTTIFIGDGVSDRFAAQEADIVFAKGHLSEWCLVEGIAHVRFAELGKVESVLRSAVISPNDDLTR
jgi:2-hydroxy-3-keto-5-methylthiopentenyl-1-phosphate phosphatase